MSEYRWNLAQWLRGGIDTSPGEVIAMLNGLPEDSKWSAHWQATLTQRKEKARKILGDLYNEPEDERSEDEKEFDELFVEYRMWNDEDRKLLATIANVSREGNSYKKEPPVIGPRSWRTDKQVQMEERVKKDREMGITRTDEGVRADSVAGFFAAMGQMTTTTE